MAGGQREGELVDAFRVFATPLISDNLARVPGAVGLRPFHKISGIMVGRALTVRTRPGDNQFIHRALDLVQPGDVIVVDGGGYEGRALVGEIMTSLAASRGAAGIVIDGAIRDAGAIGRNPFPCFARSAIHLGPYKDGPGAINVPVSVGGMVVGPGDIVVGDEDGVVAFPFEGATALLAAVKAQEAREADIMQSIKENRYQGAYAQAPASSH
ncbi:MULTISPECIES: RraA family protein [unclassified Mesorhizobium]|uniref:RraA family protein n=1 Tax=unclassified Mesorhizobium TaxID=325217 RepID=UPI0011267265|nr:MULTISPECIES: RraA family protein [unclassified Mesorhizobium]TPL01009.1 RraA family protein [Mesorhizobium sp. B2-4-16]TPL78029.1 RraA family protein [Mesorhizobium sp. B2-4-3]